MKTIIISIQIPDGVNVQVSQGGGNDRPFVERPAPPHPGGYCPIHESDWKLVPAGVSKKSGKRYNAFWVCSEQGCDEKPPRDEQPAPVDDYDSLETVPF